MPMTPEQLRQEIEVILWDCHNQSDGGGCRGTNQEGDWYGMKGCTCGLKEDIDELTALIEREKRAAVHEFIGCFYSRLLEKYTHNDPPSMPLVLVNATEVRDELFPLPLPPPRE